ncbi:MAG: hypothetical protein IPF54_13150 [Draconibacterium sp.]|nr:hypothetical protein [Draconibacterium sp.]
MQGVSHELDDLREMAFLEKISWQKCRNAKVKMRDSSFENHFQQCFGYYIEVRNTHKDKVPPDWIRKQTLVGAERYITEELKEYESKILGAEEKFYRWKLVFSMIWFCTCRIHSGDSTECYIFWSNRLSLSFSSTASSSMVILDLTINDSKDNRH